MQVILNIDFFNPIDYSFPPPVSSIPCHSHIIFFPMNVPAPYDGHLSCFQSFGPYKQCFSYNLVCLSSYLFIFLLKNIRLVIERSENKVVQIRLVYIGQTHLFWDREKLELGGSEKRIKLI